LGALAASKATGANNALIERMRRAGQKLETPPSFDEKLYLKNNPDVAAACQNGYFKSGYEHYLLAGRKEARDRTSKSEYL
jgi:hypothetical protein